jgi:ABC-type lipoprotein release transport system permease subunit
VNLPFFIARRYFFSRKNPSAINIITGISLLGYAVGAFALVSLLSALNGFEKVIFKVYNNYYPDLKISPAKGKVFLNDSAQYFRVTSSKGVQAVTAVLEENAVIQNGENQVVGLIKGVDKKYTQVVNADSLIVAGDKKLYDGAQMRSWMAEGLYYKLNLGTDARMVSVMAPDRESSGVSQTDMMEDEVRVTAVIRPGDEMDQKLLVTSLEFAQALFVRDSMISAYEIKVKPAADVREVSQELRNTLGADFLVRDRKEQNQAIYKMFNTEKWVSFALMAFVLLIISFNLVGSLSMLVLEKKRDISILKAVGMTRGSLRKLFFNEGVLVAVGGTLVGIVFGVILVIAQQKFGFVKTNSTFVSAYPVALKLSDILLITALGAGLGISASIYPAWNSSPKD